MGEQLAGPAAGQRSRKKNAAAKKKQKGYKKEQMF